LTGGSHEWWGELRHGGMLLAPQFLDELVPELPELDEAAYQRLRAAWLRFEASADDAEGAREHSVRGFVAELLEEFLGLKDWQRGSGVESRFKATGLAGEALRPDWMLTDGSGQDGLMAVKFDESETIGRGRGVRAHARLVELVRSSGVPLGLLTNGRQVRLVHAGPDYDAWAEWDARTWFDESEGRSTLRGFSALLESDSEQDFGRLIRLISTIHESRNRQGDLAQVLGEQVRRGIELLVREVDHKLDADPELRDELWSDPASGEGLPDEEVLASLYQAATRVVMRLVLVLYAESRDLLPANVEAYHDSYGVGSLYDTLARGDREGRDALAESHAAWPRMLGLFRLIYFGSAHPDLPVRAYGGQLFLPGDIESPDVVLRALAALESVRPSDAAIYQLLRLLKIGKVRVRAGRGARWVAGAVDFSDLRTEYVGIVYEGLLDYELRRTTSDDPVVLLNVGRQPALPLSRLAELNGDDLKELLKAFKKDAKTASAGEEGEEDAEPDSESEPDEHSSDDEPEDVGEGEESEEDEESTGDHARSQVIEWALRAVESAGLVRRPRGANPDMAAYEQKVLAKARGLIGGVVPPGRLYLVASGGLRKGSGSFYTRPALSVPLAQRTLEPLCYRVSGGKLEPRTPEEILDLKVCEPAMGSGSFLVAALRYLVDSLHRSLQHHGRIKARGERETVVTLPFGRAATGEEFEELLDLPPEDERFTERLRVQLARHVVERCLYGVDFNPMAAELARLALWVETLDRELPFEYLDHKLKVGNSLVGCWLQLVDDYPLRAFEREDVDGNSGERTKWLKEALKLAKGEMPEVIRSMGGATQLFDELELDVGDLVEQVRSRFESLHSSPREEREEAYRALLASTEYLSLKQRMDVWCSLWFWPVGDTSPPMPRSWRNLSPEQETVVDALATRYQFFHWEIEFPDVFTTERTGFDAVLGNPPWEVSKPNSQEFFSRLDPLYRSYGKTKALGRQEELFAQIAGLEAEWVSYRSSFKAMSNFVKASGDPYEISLGRGKQMAELSDSWADHRRTRPSLAHPEHPYRLQGSADLNTYKLFLEVAHHVLREEGRLGMLVPSGIYTDKGTTDLRKQFLEHCSWEWCYGFENREGFFPIHRSFKFVPIVVQRGGATEAVHAAFMRHDVSEWERPREHAVELYTADIRRFSPRTWSFMELKSDRDLEIVDKIYADHPLLGDVVESLGAHYAREFDMTNKARLFTSRRKLIREGALNDDDDTRDPRVRAKMRVAGYLPLYEGKCFWLHDPYYGEVGKFVGIDVARGELDTEAWTTPRMCMRNVASSTNQRTFIVGVLPPCFHGNSAPTLDGLQWEDVLRLKGILGSLTADYVVRMKVSANLNWFFLETVPVPRLDDKHEYWNRGPDLVERLNRVGSDFGETGDQPITSGPERLAARLTLDALVADLFELSEDEFAHLASQFPIYDSDAGPDFAYPALAESVYRAFTTDGPDAAESKAEELSVARLETGFGFGFDELWEPDGGWQKANEEATEILEAGGVR